MLLIRPARPADAPAMARVHVDTWRTTYGGLIPDAYLAGLSVERSAARWSDYLANPPAKGLAFVAEAPAEHIVAVTSAGPLREALEDFDAEIYALYVAQAYQGVGLGRRLVAACARELRNEGFHSLVIWVLKDNPACGFYARLGGQRNAEKVVEIGGEPLLDVAYVWPDLTVLAGNTLPSGDCKTADTGHD